MLLTAMDLRGEFAIEKCIRHKSGDEGVVRDLGMSALHFIRAVILKTTGSLRHTIKPPPKLALPQTLTRPKQQIIYPRSISPVRNHQVSPRPLDRRPSTRSERQAALQVPLREQPEAAPAQATFRVSCSYSVGLVSFHTPDAHNCRGTAVLVRATAYRARVVLEAAWCSRVFPVYQYLVYSS